MKTRFKPPGQYLAIGRITGVETMPRLNLLEWFLTYGLKDEHPEMTFTEAVEVFCYELAEEDRLRFRNELAVLLKKHPNKASLEAHWLHLSGHLWFSPQVDSWAVLRRAYARLAPD